MKFVTIDPPKVDKSIWDGLPTYLRSAAEPIKEWLQNPDVIEIMCNAPGEVWIEARGRPHIEHFPVPHLTVSAIENLAQRVAGYANQNVNQTTPLLSAAMPNGERFQAALAPAAPKGGAFSIRKPVITDLCLDDYKNLGGFDNVKVSGPRSVNPELVSDLDATLNDLLRDASPDGRVAAITFAIEHRYTALVSGGTSSGKTTLFNAAMKAIPFSERIITIEDTIELRPPQPNWLQLIASKGGVEQAQARVSVQDILEATLRMRPDRLLLGEIRGKEAFTFLQLVNTGHPGSMATVHANDPRSTFERVAMAAMQAGMGLSRSELIEYVRGIVPLVIQVGRNHKTNKRSVTEIYFDKWPGQ